MKNSIYYLAGQIGVYGLNAIFALVLINAMQPSDYAIVVLCWSIQVAASIASDLGLTHILISKAANRQQFGEIAGINIAGFSLIHRKFALISLPLLVGYGLALSGGEITANINILSLFGMSIFAGFLQTTSNLRRSVFLACSDRRRLLACGYIEALIKLAGLIFYFAFPAIHTVLLIGILGTLASIAYLEFWRNRCKLATEYRKDGEIGLGEVIPLAPSFIYTIFQGQIGLLLLTSQGSLLEVGEFGAVTRLTQILGVLTLLNGFVVQPHFARIRTREIFIKSVKILLGSFVAIASLTLILVLLFEKYVLIVLGDAYRYSGDALIAACLGTLIYLLYSALYTVAVSFGNTKLQALMPISGLLVQVVYLLNWEINTSMQAIMVQTLPYIPGIILQAWIINKRVSRLETASY